MDKFAALLRALQIMHQQLKGSQGTQLMYDDQGKVFDPTHPDRGWRDQTWHTLDRHGDYFNNLTQPLQNQSGNWNVPVRRPIIGAPVKGPFY